MAAAASSSSSSILTIGIMVMLVATTALPFAAEATMTCTDMMGSMKNCMPYLFKGSSLQKPSPECCGDLSKLVFLSSFTAEDKKTTCSCYKLACSFPFFNSAKVTTMGTDCGIKFAYSDPNFDCNTITA